MLTPFRGIACTSPVPRAVASPAGVGDTNTQEGSWPVERKQALATRLVTKDPKDPVRWPQLECVLPLEGTGAEENGGGSHVGGGKEGKVDAIPHDDLAVAPGLGCPSLAGPALQQHSLPNHEAHGVRGVRPGLLLSSAGGGGVCVGG